MRPSGITDGIVALPGAAELGRVADASMRPSGITDGICSTTWARAWSRARFNEAVGYYRRNLAGRLGGIPGARPAASMRPSGITDGILVGVELGDGGGGASMRPSGITDGIMALFDIIPIGLRVCFNEAVGYYRRNRTARREVFAASSGASMRPSGITDGITRRSRR